MFAGVEYSAIPSSSLGVFRDAKGPDVKPPNIEAFLRTENVRIENRGLSDIPDKLFDNQSVRLASFKSNKLASLPLRITSWPRLEKLNLAGNQLTAIPDSIGQLRALRDLNLEGNKLESLPEALGALPSLSSLNLNGNPPSCRVGSSATLATLWYRCGEGEQASPVPVSDIGKRTASVLEALRENLPDDVKRDVEAVARKAAQEKALSGLKKVAASGDLREVQRTLDVARRAGLPAEKTKDAEALADTLDSLSVATDCRDGAAIRSALAAFQAATSVAPRSTCGVTVARGLEVLDELRKAAAADAVRMKAEPSSVGKSAQKAKKAEADGMGAGAADASGGGDGEGGKEGAPRGDEAALEGEGSEARRKLKKQIAYEAWLSEKKHEKEARDREIKEAMKKERMRRQAEKEAAVRRAQETYSREAGWPSSVAVDMVPQPRDVHRLIESRKYRGVVKQRSGA